MTMLPLGLDLDLSALRPDPVPMPVCRERVGQDMHIYIDGNLAESGDGLSPATAVKNYEDAVLALSHYDSLRERNRCARFPGRGRSEWQRVRLNRHIVLRRNDL